MGPMRCNRSSRRKAWRRIEKLSRRAGDAPIEHMMEVGSPCTCGGERLLTPPGMSREIFVEMGVPMVAVPTHCGMVIYRTTTGLAAVVCSVCHAFSLERDDEE